MKDGCERLKLEESHQTLSSRPCSVVDQLLRREGKTPPDEVEQAACATCFAELDLGEGQRREVVGADWGQGTAGVPLREQLLRESALWVCSKMVAFNTFQGIISFNTFQLRRWELPSLT